MSRIPIPNLRHLGVVAACAATAVVLIPAGGPHLPAADPAYRVFCRLVLRPGNAFTRVGPPPAPPPDRMAALNAQPTFVVTYDSGFDANPAAKNAFAYAVSLLGAQLQSRIQVKVGAYFAPLSSPGVLGVGGSSGLEPGNWTPAAGGVPPPIFNGFYPSSLGDHLRNSDTTDPNFFPQHLNVSINSTAAATWYFGTDGNTPAGQVDFVTVALHELTHGVGFASGSSVITDPHIDQTHPEYGWTCPSPPCGSVLLPGTATSTSLGFSNVFDYFTKTVTGTSLRDSNTFPHLSQTLANQMQQAYDPLSPRGNGVYFDGPYTTHGNGGLSARLYTPGTWAGGSSMSHTDDQTYPAGNINSLMNFSTAAAESIHQLGPVELGVLADSGWAGFICAEKLGSLNNNFPRTGGTLTLSITLPSFCGWAVTNNSSFLTVSSASTGTGNGSVTFTVAANNTGVPRTGNVTINGVPYNVTQSNANVTAGIETSAADVLVTAPDSASFTVVADGDPNPTVQWQVSTDGGTTFNPLTEGSTYGGTTTSTLTVNATTAAMDGNKFRAVATNAAGSATSTPATLTVQYAPIVTTQPVDQFISVGTAVNANFTVAVSGNPSALTYQWQRSVDGGNTWSNLTEGNPFNGTQSATLTVIPTGSLKVSAVRCQISNAIGTTTSGFALLYVNSFATMAPTPRFAGTMTQVATPLKNVTGPQAVKVHFDGASGAWSVACDTAWCVVTGGSGLGDGSFTVSVAPGVTLSPGINHATLTFTSGVVTNNGFQIDVQLNATIGSQPAFGTFDTPQDGVSGVTGSIALTGWALDDIGVTAVRIVRDPVAGETPGVQIPIGTATFIDGARPDVAALNPGIPLNTRAGWGYLLLTNFLPNAGNGTFKLTAIADDVEGNHKVLGSKTITCTNSAATLPFGAIDTPDQGATATGSSYVNFGWVLAAQKTASGLFIPFDGSSITVFLDGVSIGTVTSYNHARSDIQSLFPGYANTDGAVGFKIIDTTTLSNGVHTIVWSAADNNGATAGIGSRFFSVSNNGGSVIAAASHAGLNAVASGMAITVQHGFDDGAPVEVVVPDDSGVVHVDARVLDRLTLQIAQAGASYRGYEVIDDTDKPLPVGSHLDERTGTFSWIPGPGFGGTHHLEFVRTVNGREEVIPVDVTIGPGS